MNTIQTNFLYDGVRYVIDANYTPSPHGVTTFEWFGRTFTRPQPWKRFWVVSIKVVSEDDDGNEIVYDLFKHRAIMSDRFLQKVDFAVQSAIEKYHGEQSGTSSAQ